MTSPVQQRRELELNFPGGCNVGIARPVRACGPGRCPHGCGAAARRRLRHGAVASRTGTGPNLALRKLLRRELSRASGVGTGSMCW